MFKVHNDTAETAAFALRYLDHSGISFSQIIAAVQRIRGGTYDRYLVDAAQRASINRRDATLNQAFEEIARTLYMTGDGESGNLIEEIASVLRNDFARNRLAGETLRRLRDVVLLPDEIAATRNLEASSYACGNCGVAFADGDALSKRNDGFYCSRCVPIHRAVCQHNGCTERIEIKNHERLFSRVCARHTPGVAIEEAPVATTQPVTIPEATFRGYDTMTHQARSLAEMLRAEGNDLVLPVPPRHRR